MLNLNKKVTIKTEDNGTLQVNYQIKTNFINSLPVYDLIVTYSENTIKIKGITGCKKIANDIFYKLTKFQVTPTNILNILDDYFYEIYNC